MTDGRSYKRVFPGWAFSVDDLSRGAIGHD